MNDTISQLMLRANALSGRYISTIASDLNVSIPSHTKRHKGIIGSLLELALGADAGNAPTPDFQSLGIELKTIPLSTQGIVQETTYVSAINLPLRETCFEHSSVAAKLQHVLWVPFIRRRPVGDSEILRPILWQPSHAEWNTIKTDWSELTELLRFGDEVSGKIGEVLHVRPKAANRRARTMILSEYGPIWTVPKGFYLRKHFTQAILDKYVSS